MNKETLWLLPEVREMPDKKAAIMSCGLMDAFGYVVSGKSKSIREIKSICCLCGNRGNCSEAF